MFNSVKCYFNGRTVYLIYPERDKPRNINCDECGKFLPSKGGCLCVRAMENRRRKSKYKKIS